MLISVTTGLSNIQQSIIPNAPGVVKCDNVIFISAERTKISLLRKSKMTNKNQGNELKLRTVNSFDLCPKRLQLLIYVLITPIDLLDIVNGALPVSA